MHAFFDGGRVAFSSLRILPAAMNLREKNVILHLQHPRDISQSVSHIPEIPD
jgi:hypothetical protein